MAKTASVKHNPLCTKPTLPRLEASNIPSINVDKSIKEFSPKRESNILALKPNSGVSKRKGKVQKSSKQKQRDVKRQDRAEAVMEQMEVKVGQKVKRSKAINERKVEWGIVNGEGKEARRQVIRAEAKGEGHQDGWEDVEDGDAQTEGKMEEVVDNGTTVVAAAVSAGPAPAVMNTVAEGMAADEGDQIT